VTGTALLASIWPHRRPFHRVIFNAAQSTLAAGAALTTLAMFAPHEAKVPLLDQYTNWPGLFAGGATFFAVNSGLVAMAIALGTGRSFWSTWHENFGYAFELATSAAQVSLAGFLLIAYQQMGPMAVAAVLPVLVVLWWSSAREADIKAGRSTLGRSATESDSDDHRPTLKRVG
jgi:hypothetical protein